MSRSQSPLWETLRGNKRLPATSRDVEEFEIDF